MVTDDQIRSLLADAGAVDDTVLVADCRLALSGDQDARYRVASDAHELSIRAELAELARKRARVTVVTYPIGCFVRHGRRYRVGMGFQLGNCRVTEQQIYGWSGNELVDLYLWAEDNHHRYDDGSALLAGWREFIGYGAYSG